MGTHLYRVPDDVLIEQATRTVAELRSDPDVVAAAYDTIGFDAAGFATRLHEATTAHAHATGERARARATWQRAQDALRVYVDSTAMPWLRRLRLRWTRAKEENVPGARTLDLSLMSATRADRPHSVVKQLRVLRPELPWAASILDGAVADVVSEGTAIGTELDALDAVVHEAYGVFVPAEDAAILARDAVADLLRTLDLWTAEAEVEASGPVPGSSRDVVRHWLATRPQPRPSTDS